MQVLILSPPFWSVKTMCVLLGIERDKTPPLFHTTITLIYFDDKKKTCSQPDDNCDNAVLPQKITIHFADVHTYIILKNHA